MILQTFNNLHGSSLYAKMFTISSSQPLKPVSKEQTLKYPERKGGFKFPTLYWGNGSLERPGIRVSKLRLGYWSYEGSGG